MDLKPWKICELQAGIPFYLYFWEESLPSLLSHPLFWPFCRLLHTCQTECVWVFCMEDGI